ncbi:ribosomal L27 protein-domain-containing protein [Polychytrium aggregatum]|uniref:ribosomal L27 protein-domain-containing protein n=1 Tax=Polychytrium aggregatum TaxID=110093 RepID=UPI0022FE37A0|nr:ribosomal L27 protein-domain-containing protein [Polychytrium aggregatum]KAI9208174.1 ribosomal L27 protein-domain-containing protein [Polychytrium aggregatum]
MLFSSAITRLIAASRPMPVASVGPSILLPAVPRCPLPSSFSPIAPLQVRWATKKAGGSTKNGRTSQPKFLGFKKREGAKVDQGNIIIRQRGTEWFPGNNVGIGRDHTIFALIPGTVRLHYDLKTQRRYISVDDGTLPELQSRSQLKRQLAEAVDPKVYLSLDNLSKYQYVMNKIDELSAQAQTLKKEKAEERLLMPGRRKCRLVDLTRF